MRSLHRRRVPGRLALRALACCVAALAACAPAAWARTIATSTAGFTGGPALGADGRVVVGEHRGDGALGLVAIDARTGARRGLASFAALPDPQSFPILTVTGTGGVVAATLDTARHVSGPGIAAGAWKVLASRTMIVSPSLSLVGSCPLVPNALQELAAGGTGFVATVGGECAETRSAVGIRTDEGSFGIPALLGPGDDPQFQPDVITLAANGPFASWVELRVPASGPGPSLQVVLLDVAHQQLLLRIPLDGFVYGTGLGADGLVALPDIKTCAIRVLSPQQPSVQRIALPDGLCPQALLTIGVGDGRIVYQAKGGYAVTDLQGDAHWLAGGAGSGSPIALAGRTAYVLRKDCDADRLLALDVDAHGRAPRAGAGTLRGCAARRAGPTRLRVDPRGRVALPLRCPAGCRGRLLLVQQRGAHERLVGSADYAHRAGRLAVRPVIAPFARALAGCAGGLTVAAVLYPAAPEAVVSTRHVLGVYTLHSRARCVRTGPAFGPPLPAPRP